MYSIRENGSVSVAVPLLKGNLHSRHKLTLNCFRNTIYFKISLKNMGIIFQYRTKQDLIIAYFQF